jgi:hypothetical protein
MNSLYPEPVLTLAVQHNLDPALIFGLGEGLNLYYRRQLNGDPPHLVHVLSTTFAEKLAERVAQPRPTAIAEALAGNAYGVMVCTGDWHGIDAIEKWGEELPFWHNSVGWEQSVATAATLIEQSDGLYRRAYGAFLEAASVYYEGLDTPRQMINDLAEEWLTIGTLLRKGSDLERVGARVLRMAGRESRFWGTLLDQFGIAGAARPTTLR